MKKTIFEIGLLLLALTIVGGGLAFVLTGLGAGRGFAIGIPLGLVAVAFVIETLFAKSRPRPRQPKQRRGLQLPRLTLPRLRRSRPTVRPARPATKSHPRARAARLWLRDYGRWFLLLIPLGLAVFLGWYFWPWGLLPAVLLLFVVGGNLISARRTRAGYGGMLFPGRAIIRNESYHPLAFLVYGWEWGKKFGWAHLWPLGYAALAVLATWATHLIAPKTLAHLPWWAIAAAVGGFVLSTTFWWWFRVVVWPAYRAIITDETIAMVRPVWGPVGTIDVAASEIPLNKVATWETKHRAIGSGDWDPGVILFGEEKVAFTWLRDPEDFSRAAREQLARLVAEAQAKRQR